MIFVATLALEADYNTLADAQIAIQRAVNVGDCIMLHRNKVGSSKRKPVWIGYSDGYN